MTSESLSRIARFLIAGTLATAVSAGVLHLCVSVFGMWYITGSVFGFFAGFLVSFTLQKFWTFRDMRRDVLGSQVLMYLTLLTINLGSNTLLVYFGVEFGGLSPVVAQIGASLILACQNFLVYRYVIFRSADVSSSTVLDSKNS